MSNASWIWWRGVRVTPLVRDAILAAEQRAGFTFTVTQGGYNGGAVAASAGTHDGDAADFRTRGLTRKQVETMIEALRWAGFAAWFRTANVAKWGTRAQGFASEHVHAVPNGWGNPSAGARRQAVVYRNGRDGLARNLDDLGPGHTRQWVNQTSPRKPAVIVAPVTIEKGILGMTQHVSRYYGESQTIGTGDHYLRAHPNGWWWLHQTAGITAISIHGYATAGPNCQIFICAETDEVARVLGRASLPDGTGSFSGSALATLREGEALRLQVANHAGKPITVSNVSTSILHED